MLVNIDGPEIESFKPHKTINYWYKHSTSKNKDGKTRAKRFQDSKILKDSKKKYSYRNKNKKSP